MLGTSISLDRQTEISERVAFVERVVDLVGLTDIRAPDLDETVAIGMDPFNLSYEVSQRDAGRRLFFFDCCHLLSTCLCCIMSRFFLYLCFPGHSLPFLFKNGREPLRRHR